MKNYTDIIAKQYLKEIREIEKIVKEHQMSKGEAYSSSAGDGWHDNFAFEEHKRIEVQLLRELREKMAKLKDIVIIEKRFLLIIL